MRWPYSTRVDSTHSWGMVAAGVAIIGIIVTALATIHASDPHFRWWWPTNWLIIPVAIVVVGMIAVVVPLRRCDNRGKEKPVTPQIPQSFKQNIVANSPGATAQGAAFGNVINYPEQSGNGPAGLMAAESGEEQQ